MSIHRLGLKAPCTFNGQVGGDGLPCLMVPAMESVNAIHVAEIIGCLYGCSVLEFVINGVLLSIDISFTVCRKRLCVFAGRYITFPVVCDLPGSHIQLLFCPDTLYLSVGVVDLSGSLILPFS